MLSDVIKSVERCGRHRGISGGSVINEKNLKMQLSDSQEVERERGSHHQLLLVWHITVSKKTIVSLHAHHVQLRYFNTEFQRL